MHYEITDMFNTSRHSSLRRDRDRQAVGQEMSRRVNEVGVKPCSRLII